MTISALTMPAGRSEEATFSRAFAPAVLVCLLLLAVPVKNSAYLLPPVFVAMQLLLGNFGFVRRTVLWGSLLILVSTFSLIIESYMGNEVNVPGMVLGIVTYAQIAVMLGLLSRFTISQEGQQQITKSVAWFVMIQATLGLLQFAASGNPDSVAGTFGLLDFRADEYTIGQVHLSFNLFAMVMYLLTDSTSTLAKMAIVAGLLACAVAHSGHQTLFLMAALTFVAVLEIRRRHFALLGIMVSVLLVLTASISTVYWVDAMSWYERVIHGEQSPKKQVTLSAVEVLSSPKNLLLGTGMGQYSSRAALITSGEYLQVQLPSVLVGESEYFREFVRPANDEAQEEGAEGSAMTKPYYSNLNVLVEFGLPLTTLFFVCLIHQFMQNRRLARSLVPHAQIVGMLANVGLVFFVLCCFIENYIELPQATFLPILLYVAARASAHDAAERQPPCSAKGQRAVFRFLYGLSR